MKPEDRKEGDLERERGKKESKEKRRAERHEERERMLRCYIDNIKVFLFYFVVY